MDILGGWRRFLRWLGASGDALPTVLIKPVLMEGGWQAYEATCHCQGHAFIGLASKPGVAYKRMLDDVRDYLGDDACYEAAGFQIEVSSLGEDL